MGVHVESTLELSPGGLLKVLRHRMNRNVSRSALFRWRKTLGFMEPPFYLDHVEALEIYGNFLGLGLKPDVAEKKTREELKARKYSQGEYKNGTA